MAIKVSGNIVIYNDRVIRVSADTDANRPVTPAQGMLRFSTTSNQFEGYSGAAWASVGGGVIDEQARTLATLSLT